VNIPVNKEIKIVWIIKINPIVKGWFINKKINEFIINKKKIKICIISENSLFKILILEINERTLFFFFWYLKKL
jgi:hypothetical protein